ncbi:hypothetical protein Adt_03259 [Abeliophyllum distichum]|uniref:Uncharacterized protein n=1 Tax=Abeliophyllum distichum TaxID=126358 RepID=A0ABD1VXZ8_9LAMI
MIEEISRDVARKEAKCVACVVGADEGGEVAPLTNRPKVVDPPKPTLSRLVSGGRVGEASKNNKKKGKETLPEVVSEAEPVLVVIEPLQRVLSVTRTGAIVLGELPSGSKRRGNEKEKVVVDLASSGGEQEASPREKHLREMFDELIGKMGQKLSNESIEYLDLQAALGVQAFSKYLLSRWKIFMTEGDIEDLLEASITCSICAASTSMRSLNAVK